MAMIVIIAVLIPTVVARDPTNITRSVGETDVFIPCPFEFQPSPPVWRIGGIDFTSSTLPSIFTLDPGGIYINNVTACLNGLTFQCIDTSGAGLLGRGSLTGILTVQPPGQVCGDFQEVIVNEFNAIELNHQRLKFDNGSITLYWKIFAVSSNINCTTSRIVAYPQCQANTVVYDVQTEDVNITLPTEMSELPLTFNISSLSMSNQATMCPVLQDSVSFAVVMIEVETVNLLLGNNNNCTRVEIPCEGNTHAGFANSNTSQPDIVCPIFTLDDSRCFYVNECSRFNTVANEPYPPFFRVCKDINRCYLYFQNITEDLNGLKLDIFDTISEAALQTCLEPTRRPTRRYFKSLVLEVTNASADIEITPQGEVCFYSLLQTCNLTRPIQYNISIVDNAGNPVFKNDTLPEGYCIAIGKPQCGPFTVLAQPYTIDDYIIYNPVNKEITLIEFQVRTSWVDSSRSVISVNYSCSSVYLSPQEIAIRVGDVTVKVQCSDGVTYINNTNCGADIAVCGHLIPMIQSATPNTMSFDCPLNCSYLEAPSCHADVIIKIVVPIVVILFFLVIGVLIGIVIYCKRTKVKDLLCRALGNDRPDLGPHAGEQRAVFQNRNEGFEVDLDPDQPVTINENEGT